MTGERNWKEQNKCVLVTRVYFVYMISDKHLIAAKLLIDFHTLVRVRVSGMFFLES